MQKGFTLFELGLALSLAALLAMLAYPRLSRAVDQIATDRALSGVVTFYNRARLAAVWRATAVEITFGEDSLRATGLGATDTVLWVEPGPARYGVSLSASRKVIRVYPTGLGWGAANTKLVFTRGEAAESLTTSRLGRVRRW